MIEVSHLRKQYGNLTAVDDLSFNLVPGEILGFLGPNGAGKSTTMKMLTGFLTPTSGDVRIWGCSVEDDRITAQKHIGYLPEGAPCYEEMTPASFLGFIGEVRGLSGSGLNQAIDKAVSILSLESVVYQPIETLSKGFKRRVGLAQAILHDPDVLILDEPTDGLDPNQKRQVREMIKGLSKDKIVIISTHILEEVTAVCNRVVVLARGRIVVDTTPVALLASSRYHGAIRLRFAQTLSHQAALLAFAEIEGVAATEEEQGEIILIPGSDGTGLLGRVMQKLQDSDLTPQNISVDEGRLDEVFRRLTEEVAHEA